jgi:hypothetical protein
MIRAKQHLLQLEQHHRYGMLSFALTMVDLLNIAAAVTTLLANDPLF